jgi:hypothetical protein
MALVPSYRRRRREEAVQVALPACGVASVSEALSFSECEHTLDVAAQFRSDCRLGRPDRGEYTKDGFGRHRSDGCMPKLGKGEAFQVAQHYSDIPNVAAVAQFRGKERLGASLEGHNLRCENPARCAGGSALKCRIGASANLLAQGAGRTASGPQSDRGESAEAEFTSPLVDRDAKQP